MESFCRGDGVRVGVGVVSIREVRSQPAEVGEAGVGEGWADGVVAGLVGAQAADDGCRGGRAACGIRDGGMQHRHEFFFLDGFEAEFLKAVLNGFVFSDVANVVDHTEVE